MIWVLSFIIFHDTGRNTLDVNENQPTTEKGQYSVRGKIYKPLLESTRPFIFLPFILRGKRGKRPFYVRMHKLAHHQANAASKSKNQLEFELHEIVLLLYVINSFLGILKLFVLYLQNMKYQDDPLQSLRATSMVKIPTGWWA